MDIIGLKQLDDEARTAAPFLTWDIVEKDGKWGTEISVEWNSKEVKLGQLFSTEEDAKHAATLLAGTMRTLFIDEYEEQAKLLNIIKERA